ncbi:FAD/NAD(P)-binding domain-containing protein [Hypoxylon fuscum]|nr:FAD/NAD(P)-binding domain-containing protein [Hypoxylon fuscum]
MDSSTAVHQINGAMQSSDTKQQDHAPLSVAIIGGGFVGVVLALGLLHRGIRVTIYERAPNFTEIGAGFAFAKVTRKCMARLNPAILESMERVGVPNTRRMSEYWDGYHTDNLALGGDSKDQVRDRSVEDSEDTSAALLFTLNLDLDSWGCLRAQFLEDLSHALPPGVVQFNKEFVGYSDSSSTSSLEPVAFRFADGSTSTADVLIGCDGLRSRVRSQLLATEAPLAANPTYTRKRCYRAVVPWSDGVRALGTHKATNMCSLLGPGAHTITYPVGEEMFNVVVFVTDEDDWPDPERMTILGRREDVLRRLEGWGPCARGLVSLLPEEPLVWGLFDMYDHPAPYFARGKVCLVGDAAHASAPHHGSGAGFGVEDALALATAMEEVLKTLSNTKSKELKAEATKAAFQAFNQVRYARTQWLVRSSREAGDIHEWMYPGSGMDPGKCKTELVERFKIIGNLDIDGMVEESRRVYHQLLLEKGVASAA